MCTHPSWWSVHTKRGGERDASTDGYDRTEIHHEGCVHTHTERGRVYTLNVVGKGCFDREGGPNRHSPRQSVYTFNVVEYTFNVVEYAIGGFTFSVTVSRFQGRFHFLNDGFTLLVAVSLF